MKKKNNIAREYYNYIKTIPRLSQEEIEKLYASENIPYTDLEVEIKNIKDEQPNNLNLNKEELRNKLKEIEQKLPSTAYRYYLTIIGRKHNIRKYPSNELRNKIVNGNLYLVMYYASTYYKKEDCNIEFDDLVQIGYEALMSAAYYYVPGGEAKFKTYCSKCIRNKLNKTIYESKKMKKRSYKVKDFFEAETHKIEQLEMFLTAEYQDKCDRFYTDLPDRKVIRRLDNLIKDYNRHKWYREESKDILRKVGGKDLDYVLARFAKLISESKLNILITPEEKRDIDDYLNYKRGNGRSVNYYKVKSYLDIYKYKLDLIKRYIDAEKTLHERGAVISDENILKEMNNSIKKLNQQISELKRSGFFDKCYIQYRTLYDFWGEYFEAYDVDLFESEREKESEEIGEKYNYDYYECLKKCFLKLKDIASEKVVIFFDYYYDETLDDYSDGIFIKDVVPYVPYEQLTSEDKEIFDNEEEFYSDMIPYDCEEKKILPYEYAMEILNKGLKDYGTKEEFIKRVKEQRKQTIKTELQIKNEPIKEANRKMKETEDLLKLGERYHKYIKQQHLNSIKENIRLLYTDDPELLDLLIGQTHGKNKRMSVEEEAMQSVFMDDYYEALSSLTKMQQDILNLYYDEFGYHVLTVNEIATMLGILPSKVKYEKTKAIGKLRQNKKLITYNEESV